MGKPKLSELKPNYSITQIPAEGQDLRAQAQDIRAEAQALRAEAQFLRAEAQALRAKAQLLLKPSSSQLKPKLKPKLLELKPKFSHQHDQDLTPKHNPKNDPKMSQNRSKNHQKSIKNRSKMGIWSGFEGRLASGSPQSPSGDPPGPSESRFRAQLRPNLSQLGAKLGSS